MSKVKTEQAKQRAENHKISAKDAEFQLGKLAELARNKDVTPFIKQCRKKGGILDYMRQEIRTVNSCYIY